MAYTPAGIPPINRLIIVGNGFDLAHGLPTKYQNFIDDFWNSIIHNIFLKIKKNIEFNGESLHFENDFLRFDLNYTTKFSRDYIASTWDSLILPFEKQNSYSFSDFKNLHGIALNKIRGGYLGTTSIFNNSTLGIKNNFFLDISSNLVTNWVDIETEYYKRLEHYAKTDNFGGATALNNEFERVKQLLVSYLKENIEQKFEKGAHEGFTKILNDKKIKVKELSGTKFAMYGKDEIWEISNTKLLNFNYTDTPVRYFDKNDIIQIHGSLDSDDKNPIIFGYGDESKDSYLNIENKDNNVYLQHIKSFIYSQTSNYNNLLSFIDSNYFQVYLLGHSCGLSDRVLLKTLFEHENCKSIKLFFHKIDESYDDYADKTMNISRHFSDKVKMRKLLVNKEYCEAMPKTELKKIS